MGKRARLRHGGIGAVAGLVILGINAFSGAVPAQAHNTIAEYVPAAGSTVTSADKVCVTFTQDMLKNNAAFAMRAPGEAADAAPRVIPAEFTDGTRTLCAPVQISGGGEYSVTWQAVAADGHLQSGDWTFTVDAPVATQTPSDQTPDPVISVEPDVVPQQPSSSDESSNTDKAEESSGFLGISWVQWVLYTIAAGGLYVAWRGSRKSMTRE